jgi:hypothetical protein
VTRSRGFSPHSVSGESREAARFIYFIKLSNQLYQLLQINARQFSAFFLFFCKLFQNPRGLPHPSSFKNSRIARTKASALSTVDKWPPEI